MIYEIPLFPLRMVLFPGQALPLHIFEPRYRQMMADCLDTDRTFGVALIREGVEVGGPAVPYEVGTTATIQNIERLNDGRMNVISIGRERFRIQNYETDSKPYLVGQVTMWPWEETTPSPPVLNKTVRQQLKQYIKLLSQATHTNFPLNMLPDNPTALAILAAVVLQVSPEQKQTLLETLSVGELLRQLDPLLRQESRGLGMMLASLHMQVEMNGPFSQN